MFSYTLNKVGKAMVERKAKQPSRFSICKYFLPLYPTPTTLQESLKTKFCSVHCAQDPLLLLLAPGWWGRESTSWM